MRVQRQSKQEYLARMQGRYLKATKEENGKLLDEIVAVTGSHRRHAVRVLRHGRFPDPKLAAVQGKPAMASRRAGGRPRVYSSVVVGALRTAAEASNWLCGQRLAPFLPELVPRPWALALEAEGELRLTSEDRAQLLAIAQGAPGAHHRPALAAVPLAARSAQLARAGHDQTGQLTQESGTDPHLHADGPSGRTNAPASWRLISWRIVARPRKASL